MAIYQFTLPDGRCTRVSREDIGLCTLRWSVVKWKHKWYVKNWNLGALHRVVATLMGYDIKGKSVHHIDGDSLNNERQNLLVCSPSTHRWIHETPRREAKLRLLKMKNERREHTLAYRDQNRK